MEIKGWMVDAAAAGAIGLWTWASYGQSVRAGADEGAARRAALVDAALLGVAYVAARRLIFETLESRAILSPAELPAVDVTPRRGPGRPRKAPEMVTVAGAAPAGA